MRREDILLVQIRCLQETEDRQTNKPGPRFDPIRGDNLKRNQLQTIWGSANILHSDYS